MGSSTLTLAILSCVCSYRCVWRQMSHSLGTVYLACFVLLRQVGSAALGMNLCVCPQPWIASMCHHTLFLHGFWDTAQVLLRARQALYQVSHPPPTLTPVCQE